MARAPSGRQRRPNLADRHDDADHRSTSPPEARDGHTFSSANVDLTPLAFEGGRWHVAAELTAKRPRRRALGCPKDVAVTGRQPANWRALLRRVMATRDHCWLPARAPLAIVF